MRWMRHCQEPRRKLKLHEWLNYCQEVVASYVIILKRSDEAWPCMGEDTPCSPGGRLVGSLTAFCISYFCNNYASTTRCAPLSSLNESKWCRRLLCCWWSLWDSHNSRGYCCYCCGEEINQRKQVSNKRSLCLLIASVFFVVVVVIVDCVVAIICP